MALDLRSTYEQWNREIYTRDLRHLESVRYPITSQYSARIAGKLTKSHLDRFENATVSTKPGAISKRGVANQWLYGIHRELRTAKLTKAYDEELIREFSENYARRAANCGSLEQKESFARTVGVEPPAGKSLTKKGAAGRLECPRWWRRQLRKAWTRKAENGMRELGIIRRGEAPYASDEAVNHRRNQKKIGREFLEQREAVNELDEQLNLLEVTERSISNPTIRRGELMTRVKGFEHIAIDVGHVCDFWTLTAPSAFHAQLAKAGSNPRFEKQTVRDAQLWLRKMWARTRAFIKRKNLNVYGFRVAEPHHDGTPHWHLLLFGNPATLDVLRFRMRAAWLSEYGEESNAENIRSKVERLDPAKGSAVGYIAKYISKNIDAAGTIGPAEDFETGLSVIENVERIEAWSRLHGIRQFQQIGGPPVGIWREVRKLRDPVKDQDIERARLAADAGKWDEFWRAVTCNDLTNGRKTALILEKEQNGECNRYGELSPKKTVGIRYCSTVVITRVHMWRIRKCARKISESKSCSSLGPVSITVLGVAGLGEPRGWTNPQETSQAGPK